MNPLIDQISPGDYKSVIRWIKEGPHRELFQDGSDAQICVTLAPLMTIAEWLRPHVQAFRQAQSPTLVILEATHYEAAEEGFFFLYLLQLLGLSALDVWFVGEDSFEGESRWNDPGNPTRLHGINDVEFFDAANDIPGPTAVFIPHPGFYSEEEPVGYKYIEDGSLEELLRAAVLIGMCCFDSLDSAADEKALRRFGFRTCNKRNNPWTMVHSESPPCPHPISGELVRVSYARLLYDVQLEGNKGLSPKDAESR